MAACSDSPHDSRDYAVKTAQAEGVNYVLQRLGVTTLLVYTAVTAEMAPRSDVMFREMGLGWIPELPLEVACWTVQEIYGCPSRPDS